MNNSQAPVARRDGLVIQEMSDEILVYDLNENKAHCLNQTAAFVWKFCDGQNTVRDIGVLLEKEFGSPVSEEMIWLAIDMLNKDNLLEAGISLKYEGISRREVIKKVGLGAAVALPLVAMLSFPQVSLAVACPPSICGLFGQCPPGQPFCCFGTCAADCVPPCPTPFAKV